MKQVVQLDANGYFAGFTEADESPLEPGVFLLPAGAIDVGVPTIPEGKRAKWDGKWVIQDSPRIKSEREFNTYSNGQIEQQTKAVRNPTESIFYWAYDDILTSEACDSIVETYTQEAIKTEPPVVGGDTSWHIDTNVRNVERVLLPTYKDLGARLTAAGLDANNALWKFNVTHANQAEFLKYPTGGRYIAHIDTFLNPEGDCRKLTILAFLNDDFEGGKFFMQDQHDKHYPPQKKGTVLVMPSFLLHGVEDITSGTRYSAVCWLVGPFFK